jgi:diaminopropionate ammonia-lyase
VTVLVNPAYDRARVPPATDEATAFHTALPGYRPTPLHDLGWLAAETGADSVLLKDESNRFGLPAFKVLGASWAVERTLRERPEVHTLVAASAGNHGRAVAHVAATRGLRCRIFLPAGSAPARQEAIESEGADVVMVDGLYEDAVLEARAAAAEVGVVEVADVGTSPQAAWVVEGYATLFTEAEEQGEFDMLVVPVGVGSLAAAAVRFAAPRGLPVVGVEPATAACLTASIAAGRPTAVPTPGTTMAGLNCAEISASAWPVLEAGIAAMVTVDDNEVQEAMRALPRHAIAIGDSGAAPVAALGEALRLGLGTRALLTATEGPTDRAGYRRTVEPALYRD